jgi:cyclase
VHEAISVPMTMLGGAGSLQDIAALIRAFGIVGAAAGSLFVFKGIYRAVLINYPSRVDKDVLVAAALG